MKSILFLTIILSTFFVSCRKESLEQQMEGDYKGVFYRQLSNASSLHSTISLHFAHNKFSGLSNVQKYPAICQGSYLINGTVLSVTNTCAFTAEFDWTYIFNGEYHYEINDSHLRIWKTYPDGKRDVYILER